MMLLPDSQVWETKAPSFAGIKAHPLSLHVYGQKTCESRFRSSIREWRPSEPLSPSVWNLLGGSLASLVTFSSLNSGDVVLLYHENEIKSQPWCSGSAWDWFFLDGFPLRRRTETRSPLWRIWTRRPATDDVPPAGFIEELVMSHLPPQAADKHPDDAEVGREQKSFSPL